MSENLQRRKGICGFTPCEADVQDLIRKAEGHQLGTEFLRTGALDAVAAMFEVHAFVVEAARRKLNGAGRNVAEVHTLATGAQAKA